MYLLIVDRQSNSDWGTRPFTRSRGAPAQPEILDSGRQLELDFRAPVLQLVLPDQKTQEFWRATADDPTEYARRIAKFSVECNSARS